MPEAKIFASLPGGNVPPHVPAGHVVDVDIYAPPGIENGFHAAWAALQASAPEMAWTSQNGGHWIALGGEAMQQVQSDADRFSSRVIILPKAVGELHGLIPTTIDPPEHRPYRVLLNANLNPAAIRGLAHGIRVVAIELIESFASDGYCDFTTQYAEVFPIRVFLSLVGLPESDAPQIMHWANCITRPEQDLSFEQAKEALFDYLGPVVDTRRVAPGDDMLSLMMASDMNGRKLTRDEALALCTQVLVAGVDTVVNFLSFVMIELAENHSLRAALRSDPQRTLAAVNELFRRFGLVTIAREVRDDMVFRGIELKAGEMVAIPTVVHGIDPAINPNPETIQLDRARPRHSAFGSGPHMCPGQELARQEVAVTIGEWLARIPDFRIAPSSDLSCVPGIVGAIRRLCIEWDVCNQRA